MPDINEFTFWKASCVQNPKNCTYPTKVIVTDADSFNEMAHFDHVTAEYENCYRSNYTFLGKHLHRHLPYRSRRFVIEADHAVAAKCLYLAFVDEGSVRDVHAVGHHPCTLMREIFVVLYCIGLDCSVFVGQSDPHGNHGTVLIMLAYHIYKLLVVTFSHDVPLYTVFSHSLAGIYCRTFVRLCKEGYIRAKSQPLP